MKGVETFQFEMHPDSRGACNLTEYGLWALSTAFDPEAYHAAVNAIPPSQYWDLMGNDTALTAYLAATPLKNLGRYFSAPDTRRERCMTPDPLAGMWDVSATYACPTVVTFPHFHQADPFLAYTTGNASSWAPDPIYHGWFYAIEPFTGFGIQGHKTGQMSALVTKSTHLYPDLWVVPGSGAAIGMPDDFVTGERSEEPWAVEPARKGCWLPPPARLLPLLPLPLLPLLLLLLPLPLLLLLSLLPDHVLWDTHASCSADLLVQQLVGALRQVGQAVCGPGQGAVLEAPFPWNSDAGHASPIMNYDIMLPVNDAKIKHASIPCRRTTPSTSSSSPPSPPLAGSSRASR